MDLASLVIASPLQELHRSWLGSLISHSESGRPLKPLIGCDVNAVKHDRLAADAFSEETVQPEKHHS